MTATAVECPACHKAICVNKHGILRRHAVGRSLTASRECPMSRRVVGDYDPVADAATLAEIDGQR